MNTLHMCFCLVCNFENSYDRNLQQQGLVKWPFMQVANLKVPLSMHKCKNNLAS